MQQTPIPDTTITYDLQHCTSVRFALRTLSDAGIAPLRSSLSALMVYTGIRDVRALMEALEALSALGMISYQEVRVAHTSFYTISLLSDAQPRWSRTPPEQQARRTAAEENAAFLSGWRQGKATPTPYEAAMIRAAQVEEQRAWADEETVRMPAIRGARRRP